MNTKTFVIDLGEGKYSLMCGDADDPGFISALKSKGRPYFEKDEDTPLVDDDPWGHFMPAYEFQEGKLVINMEKAKKGYLDWLKELRETKLRDLDAEQVRALGNLDFDKIKEIESVKQDLRDLPEIIDWESIETIYDLMHVFPPILQ